MPQNRGPEEPPSEGRGTRELILELAISALEAGPESGLVILDLSRNSGISMGSIYHFFENREGLIVAAQVERYRRSLGSPLKEFIAELEAAPDRATFRAVVVRLLDEMDTETGRQRRLMRANVYGTLMARPALLDQVRSAHGELEAGIAAMIRRAQQRGIVSAGLDADTFAAWWHGLLAGRVIQDSGLTAITVERWSRMSRQAMFALAFAEIPEGD